MYSDIPAELRLLIEPVVVDAGFELVDVVLRRGQSPWLLRIVIDTPTGDGRVPVDMCAQISREVETQLDAEDAIASAYRLEVSSPGLNRVLAREKDFAAMQGSEVSLETRLAIEGRKRFRGTLVSFADGTAKVEADGVVYCVPFDRISKAKAIYQFSSSDFSGKDSA